jgi:hypothetical protein
LWLPLTTRWEYRMPTPGSSSETALPDGPALQKFSGNRISQRVPITSLAGTGKNGPPPMKRAKIYFFDYL